MKQFLNSRSRQHGHDGWALRVRGWRTPMIWTVCTTWAEARELRSSPEFRDLGGDKFGPLEVVKVTIGVEAVE